MISSPAARTEADWERVRSRRLRRRARVVWGRRAVNLFLIWHCFALFVWLAPGNWTVVPLFVPADGGGAVRTYLIATGFQQSWLMFSPNPDSNNFYLTARVTFKDGTERVYMFPRIRDMKIVEKYRRERWRKMEEIADYQDPLWPGLARYAARTVAQSASNPPVFVALSRHHRAVPPPGQPAMPYREELFYRTNITLQDLARP